MIEEGTVLDARNGGIYVGPGAYISQSRIVGPAYIGSQTQVKQFSIIEKSYVGRNCRVAGEIEHSIISD
jgi:NDP-sugar pyrophosphorylase family protein